MVRGAGEMRGPIVKVGVTPPVEAVFMWKKSQYRKSVSIKAHGLNVEEQK